MSQVARDAVLSVALILVGATSGKAGAPALSACMERMVSEFKVAVNSITQSAIDEVKTASSALTATSMQFQATATSYRDILASKGLPTNPAAAAATTMDVRVRVREGVKARQILIDAQGGYTSWNQVTWVWWSLPMQHYGTWRTPQSTGSSAYVVWGMVACYWRWTARVQLGG